jgi:hypothetical protein
MDGSRRKTEVEKSKLEARIPGKTNDELGHLVEGLIYGDESFLKGG